VTDLEPEMAAARRALAGGDPEAAERLFRTALKARPDAPEALHGLAVALRARGRAAEAEAAARRALAAAPDRAALHTVLGAALKDQGRLEAAMAAFREAVARAPDDADAWMNLGVACQAGGRGDAAAEAYGRVIALAPDHAVAHLNLGLLHQAGGDPRRALTHLERAAALRPDLAPAQRALGDARMDLGLAEAARDALARAVALEPDHVGGRCRLAGALLALGDGPGCLAEFDAALARAPNAEEVVAGKARALETLGDREAAWALLAPRLDVPRPGVGVLTGFAALSRRLGREEEALARIRRRLEDDGLADAGRAALGFAAGSLSDRLERYDEAFALYREANARSGARYDPAETERLTERLTAAFPADALRRLPRASGRDGRPVFIVGMPRSGTSLVEQIVGSHPAVHPGGERMDVPRAAAALPGVLGTRTPYPECVAGLTAAAADRLAGAVLAAWGAGDEGAERLTDKLPQNFLHLGLIALLFPGARVIHCARDPLDTCLSCYFQPFVATHQPYAFDLGALGHYYRQYRRLMRHWAGALDLPLLEVRYEDLVARQEAVSREVIAFLGLDWDDACLRFHESARTVYTASYAQVRRPMYASSAGRWRRYAAHLGPLIEALGDEAPPEALRPGDGSGGGPP